MKTIFSNELKSRLTHAAENGSVIASDILNELKKNVAVSEIIKGNYNCFSTKRKRSSYETHQKIRIVFTACNKDLSHESFPDRNNPQAPWFPENRTDLEPSTFIGLFKNLREYDNEEIGYFSSAITLDSKVSVKLLTGMNEFMDAYLESNYSPVADCISTLHNSCMRYEEKARNAADFYANFAGAKILVARDGSNNVTGRAVVWEDAIWQVTGRQPVKVSLTDRMYVSHTFLIKLMYKEAQKLGINFRKTHNDYSHTQNLTVLNPVEGSGLRAGDDLMARLRIPVPACRWHKRGAPYMDTFSNILFREGQLELTNYDDESCIAVCKSTDGRASLEKKYCPKCGKVHTNHHEEFCPECASKYYTDTIFGKVTQGSPVSYNGKVYPSILFKKGKPIPEFRRYLQIQKLYTA